MLLGFFSSLSRNSIDSQRLSSRALCRAIYVFGRALACSDAEQINISPFCRESQNTRDCARCQVLSGSIALSANSGGTHVLAVWGTTYHHDGSLAHSFPFFLSFFLSLSLSWTAFGENLQGCFYVTLAGRYKRLALVNVRLTQVRPGGKPIVAQHPSTHYPHPKCPGWGWVVTVSLLQVIQMLSSLCSSRPG